MSAYSDGRRARRQGVPVEPNPFGTYPGNSTSWRRGWNDEADDIRRAAK